uniref:uncharacterized protein LOC122590518 isoform X2 n=1 Tax=Erigeron canadensis TaxID=72917 RepID=UPI001CB8BEF1|nr:uncharacterized protein LOC122590518 isoform X2 [Erigeron canadensis]
MTIFPGVKYTLEHRWKTDDAWYTCGVILEDGKHLRVKFEEEEGASKTTENDEVFSISDFSNQEQIDAFRNKFRPVSAPIEDNECAKVIQGMIVCAAYSDDGNYRYFDAVVDAVCYKEHSPEKCVCKYLLFWKHGPGEGNITKTNLQDICLIRHGAVDPILADFTKLVKEKLKGDFSQFILIPKSSSFLSKSNETSDKSQEFGSARQNSQVGFHEGKGRFWSELIDQERDVGGLEEIGCHHYLILENLEKDLCPNVMTEFIHQQTSIAIHAYVFPSLAVETYARGAVVVDSRSKLKRLYEFISNPNHFIISLSGRPWVIAEDTFWIGTFDINLRSLQPKFEAFKYLEHFFI